MQRDSENLTIPRIYDMDQGTNNFNNTTSASHSALQMQIDVSRYIGILVGFLVIVLGTTGNGLTVWAYSRNRNLQTSFNVLIANLCMVELVFSILVIPLTLPGYISGTQVYGREVCSVVGYFYYVFLASALHNLVAIAVNRYVGIVKPKKYQKLFTGRRLRICIATIWLTAPILYLPVVIGGAIEWSSSTLRCSIGTVGNPAIKWYNLVLNIIFQAVPLVILIVLYTAILRKVKLVQAKLKLHKSTSKGKVTLKKLQERTSVSSLPQNRSGNTSDDTEDDLRPSSLIEGLQFKPIPVEISLQSESDHRTPQSSGTNQSQADVRSNDVIKRVKKRNSVWAILLRNSQKIDLPKMTVPEIQLAMPEIKSQDATDDEPSDQDQLAPEINLRKNSATIRALRRKKSLSVPSLPQFNSHSYDDKSNEETSQYLQVSKQQEIETTHSDSAMSRTRSAYCPRSPDTNRLRTKSSWSVRMKQAAKDISSSWSVRSGDEDEPRARSGTIARKIQEKRAKKMKADKRARRREKIMKKKHARERQLVYSSLTICIAFAVCILPTSLLYLATVLFKVEASASALMVVGYIAWFHAVVNPIIYGYLNSQYRREYLRILRFTKEKLLKKGVA